MRTPSQDRCRLGLNEEEPLPHPRCSFSGREVGGGARCSSVPPGNPEVESGRGRRRKDSETVQEKCQTVSHRMGAGPSTATQESGCRPGTVPRGCVAPSEVLVEERKAISRSWLRQKCHTPTRLETGSESESTRLLPGSENRQPSCHCARTGTGQPRGCVPAPRPQPSTHAGHTARPRPPHPASGAAWGQGGHQAPQESPNPVPPSAVPPKPQAQLAPGGHTFSCLYIPSRNPKNVSFNQSPRAAPMPPPLQYLGGGAVTQPYRPSATTSWEKRKAPLAPTGGGGNSCPETADRKPGHTPPPPIPPGRGWFLSLGLQGLALGRCQIFAGNRRQLLPC